MKSPISFLRLSLLFLLLMVLTYITWLGTLAVPGLKEAKAFKALETEFYYSEHVSMYSQASDMEQSHGSLTDDLNFQPRSRVAAFFATPLRLVDPNDFQRRRALSLYALSTTNALPSLELLTRFSQLEHLELQCQQGWKRSFSERNLKTIQALPRLRTLGIRGDIDGDLRLLEGLPLDMLWVRGKIHGDLQLPPELPLRRLIILGQVQGDLDFLDEVDLHHLRVGTSHAFTQAGCERVAANTALKSLYLEGEFEDATCLERLATLPGLELLSFNPCPPDLAALNALPALKTIYLREQLSVPAIQTLAGHPTLTGLELAGSEFDDAGLPQVVDQLPALEAVNMEFLKISTASIDGLRARGFSADSFWGAKDHQLQENYVQYQDAHWAIQTRSSSANLLVDADTGQLQSYVNVATADPYGPTVCTHPTAESPTFLFEPGEHPGIIGQVTTNIFDPEDCNIYYCTHEYAYQNSLTLVSLQNHELHLQWHFTHEYAKPGDDLEYLVDATLPVSSIEVKSELNDLSEEAAVSALNRHLVPGTYPSRERVDDRTWIFRP